MNNIKEIFDRWDNQQSVSFNETILCWYIFIFMWIWGVLKVASSLIWIIPYTIYKILKGRKIMTMDYEEMTGEDISENVKDAANCELSDSIDDTEKSSELHGKKK